MKTPEIDHRVCTFTRGVSASGKTTWAHEQCRLAATKERRNLFVSQRDDIRWEIMRRQRKVPCWKNWSWKNEARVTEIQDEYLLTAARQGLEIIVADTNIDDVKIDHITALLAPFGYRFEIKRFDITWEEAVRRDAARQHGVGYDVLAKQFQKMYGEKLEDDPTLPRAVIVDIDGTIAKMDGRRGPFEWHKVLQDRVDDEIRDIVESLAARGYDVLFVSGRDGISMQDTRGWLEDALDCPFHLFMRAEKDQRPDNVVKREIFDEYIRGNWNVRLVLDDRPKVCREWRLMGLKVLQVGNPYIEF